MLSINKIIYSAALGLAPVVLFGCNPRNSQGHGGTQVGDHLRNGGTFDPDCAQAADHFKKHIRSKWYDPYCCTASGECIGGKKPEPNEKMIDGIWEAVKTELKNTGVECSEAEVKKIIEHIWDGTFERDFWPYEKSKEAFYARIGPAKHAVMSHLKKACERAKLPCDDDSLEAALNEIGMGLMEELGKDEVMNAFKNWKGKDDDKDGMLDIDATMAQAINDWVANKKAEM